MLVRDYIEYLQKLNTENIFGDGLYDRLQKINDAYGDTESSMVMDMRAAG